MRLACDRHGRAGLYRGDVLVFNVATRSIGRHEYHYVIPATEYTLISDVVFLFGMNTHWKNVERLSWRDRKDFVRFLHSCGVTIESEVLDAWDINLMDLLSGLLDGVEVDDGE